MKSTFVSMEYSCILYIYCSGRNQPILKKCLFVRITNYNYWHGIFPWKGLEDIYCSVRLREPSNMTYRFIECSVDRALWYIRKIRNSKMHYFQCISIINLYKFQAGLLLNIKRYYSVHISYSSWYSHVFMLTLCWQDRSCQQPVNITHDIYQLLFKQIRSSLWWAVSLLETCRC
jgi:hypothetical protein